MTDGAAACELCPGGCAGIDLVAVRGEHLDWFWRQLAAVGDRRGDADLVTGTARVTVPTGPTERAAALGLLGGRTPRGGQTVRVDLADLTDRLRAHGPRLTPGMIAAHVTLRRLGERVHSAARRREDIERLRQHAIRTFSAIPDTARVRPDIEGVWADLLRTGWVARLMGAEDPASLTRQAALIIAELPPVPERRDRRRLADAVTRNPHALDAGALPGLVLAVLVASGAVPLGLPPRTAWAAVGVDCDDLTGGLLALGLHPHGWSLPPDTVVTIPPRELSRCAWPTPPHPGIEVFVTENPSVVTAAADLAATTSCNGRPVRLLCTVGTPSAREIEAIARLAAAGWRVAVRADFDEAGLAHVDALLRGVPTARPWRMGARDYLASLAEAGAATQVTLRDRALPGTPWDPALQHAMSERGLAAYEETLIDCLLEDLTGDDIDVGKMGRDRHQPPAG